MKAALWLLAASILAPAYGAGEGKREAANYSSASIVNAATNLIGAYAPNTIITVYGEGLAYDTKGISSADIQSGRLPTVIKGVRILVNNIAAGLYYVSPTQINCLAPGNLLPGRVELQLVHDGRAGPAVRITLRAAAPGLFQLDAKTAIATRPDGTLLTREARAEGGDIVVLYATGLGRTVPDFWYGELPNGAAWLRAFSDFNVFLNGAAVDRRNILYAGAAPGYAGLYQVNLRLPEEVEADPEIRLALGEEISPAGIAIPVRGR
ncbi:MAG: IPT/TIG domain-containing protein [Bryobacteraceae bacterium]|nr:IPT/TIG domain-containing protein [Bryobacteraceae bacterium]